MKRFALLFISLFSYVSSVFAEEKMNQIISSWQKDAHAPVVLIKELDTPLNSPEFRREGSFDESSKLLVGVVELSATEKAKPGTVVFLELGTEGQPGAGPGASRYWIAYISEETHPEYINGSESMLYLVGEFTYVWNGNELKKAPHSLHGIWKQMLDKVLDR